MTKDQAKFVVDAVFDWLASKFSLPLEVGAIRFAKNSIDANWDGIWAFVANRLTP